MTYDYSGGWNSATGSNTQLFGDGGSINYGKETIAQIHSVFLMNYDLTIFYFMVI